MRNRQLPYHTFVICAYRESSYLEACIQSLLAQTVMSRIYIATSTPNAHIQALADAYELPVVVNPVCAGIGSDFDFALQAAKTPFVTLVHQDDIYMPEFTETVLRQFRKDTLISFTDYWEGDARGEIIVGNRNLLIKKILLSPLRIYLLQQSRMVRRLVLSLGNPICCPSVTFRRKQIPAPLFTCDMKSNIDWYAWEQLANMQGRFSYIPRPLMMHRIHSEATTTKVIEENGRTAEDLEMLGHFWPVPIAKLIYRYYSKAEESVSNL